MTIPDDRLLAWARAAGEAALPAFALMLALLLAGAWLLDRGWRHDRLHRWRSTLPPTALMGAAFAAGFVAVMAAGLLFAGIAEEVMEAGRLGALDHAFTAGVQAGTPAWAVQAFAIVTHLGDTVTLVALGTIVALALLRTGRHRLALSWVAATSGGGLLNWSLKQVFARARPEHAQAEGYSFPSGHSSGSLVVYGMLAYLALRLAPPRWHRAAVLGAAGTALTVGASRVFLRVHFASDVLAGLAVGAAWLGICVGAIELARRTRRARTS